LRALDFSYTYAQSLVTIASIGLGLDGIKKLPDPFSTWTQCIRQSGYCINLLLSRPEMNASFKALDFVGSMVVHWEDLGGSFLETVEERIENTTGTGRLVLPLVLITWDLNATIQNITLVANSFEMDGPITHHSGLMVADVEKKLHTQICKKLKTKS
jgi:hypothetical protein